MRLTLSGCFALLTIAYLLISSAGAHAQGGSGLRAEYYIFDPALGTAPSRTKVFVPENLRLVRVDPAVQFWLPGLLPPVAGLPAEHYAIRWSGQVMAPIAGDYTFSTTTDDGVRLWINSDPIHPATDAPLINHWQVQPRTEYSTVPIHLDAGVRYNVIMEYYNDTGFGSAYLSWSGPQLDKVYVPQEQLFPTASADSAPPGRIGDLAVASVTDKSVTLQWTATGDDGGTGASAFYDLRYAPTPITAANFDQARRVVYSPKPVPSGTSQIFTLTGLASNQPYWFALRAGDKDGNLGDVSNVTSTATLPTTFPAAPDQGLLREVYLNLESRRAGLIEDMRLNERYPGHPDVVGYLKSFEVPTGLGDLYGQRVRGFITAPLTGDYTFWIAADDAGQLFLSTDDHPDHAREIATVLDYTLPREWTKYTTQKSATISLVAGRRYYIEAVMGQGVSGDHLSVKWRLPNGVSEEPIPAKRLTPLAYPTSPGSVQGTVTDAVGKPVVGVRVVVRSGDLILGGNTDVNGYYSTLSPVGDVQIAAILWASPFGAHVSTSLPVAAGQLVTADLKFPLPLNPPPGTISSVTETEGSAVGQALLTNMRDTVAVDRAGNTFIVHQNTVLKKDPQGKTVTVAGTGAADFYGDNGLAINAALNTPQGLAVDLAGNLFIADTFNHRVRKVDTSGIISTVAGTGGQGYSGDNGPATLAKLVEPSGVAIDQAGNLFIADRINKRIRKVDTNGVITTVAGTGEWGYTGAAGAAKVEPLAFPQSVAVDSLGNLFIAEATRIRRVDTQGKITTLAGTWAGGESGDGGPASDALLNLRPSLAVDHLGDLYLGTYTGTWVRKITGVAAPALTTPISLSSDGTGRLASEKTRPFTVSDARLSPAPPEAFAWSVDGLPGGSPEVGTISPSGLYTAPAGNGTHTITAERDGAAGAAVVSVSPCMKGDVDGDEAVSLNDAILLLKMIVSNAKPSDECAQSATDANGDGSLTVADVILVLRAIVGLPTTMGN